MEKIIIAGNLIVDSLKEVDVYPKPTFLGTIKAISRSTGGAVCNVSIDLQKMSEAFQVYALGLIGDDEDGEFVLSALKKNRVDVGMVKKKTGNRTSFTDVINEASGRRTFFQFRGANALLSEEDFPMDAIKEAGLVHVGYALLLDELDSPDPEYGTKMARLLKKIQEQGTATSLDLVSDSSLEKVQRIVRPSLPYCDYLIINEAEAASVSGIPTASSDGKTDVEGVKKALRELKALGVKRKAFIHCPEFGAVINENGEIFVVNSLHLPEGFIVGSTGAGDAFCAGVLYGLIHGWSEEKILRYASYSAANNLSSLSASDGAKSEAEIWDLGAKYSQ